MENRGLSSIRINRVGLGGPELEVWVKNGRTADCYRSDQLGVVVADAPQAEGKTERQAEVDGRQLRSRFVSSSRFAARYETV